jgi:hypothetical protein
MAFAAVQQEVRRNHRRLAGVLVPHQPCPSFAAALLSLGWLVNAAGVWTTPFGSFLPGFISTAVLRKTAEESWLRLLWATDPKAEGPLKPDQHFFLDYHRHQAHQLGSGHRRRVLHAAAHDARTLHRMQLPVTPCDCGEQLPTRTHVTFYCPVLGNPALAVRSSPERRLLVPLLEGLTQQTWADPDPSEALLLALSEAPVLHDRVIVAIDGSCLQNTKSASMDWFRCAGWGIALSQDLQFAGPVPGLDRSPAAAERYALLVLAAAAGFLGLPVCILCDNKAITDRLRLGPCSAPAHSELAAFWHRVHALLPEGSVCHWIPSHGKLPSWSSPIPGLSTADARQLNAFADEAACAITEGFRDKYRCADAQLRALHAWSATAVELQLSRTTAFHAAVAAAKQRVTSDLV